jgi:hypothetical protein
MEGAAANTLLLIIHGMLARRRQQQRAWLDSPDHLHDLAEDTVLLPRRLLGWMRGSPASTAASIILGEGGQARKEERRGDPPTTPH